MAQANYQMKFGSVNIELITGAVTANGASDISHKMGEVPDAVFITPTSNVVVYQDAAPTASVINITGSATGTCNILVIKADTKQVY